MEESVIYNGWVMKKKSSTILAPSGSSIFKSRFLVLSSSQLKYFHKGENSEVSEAPEAEISLAIVHCAKLIETHDYDQSFIYFQVDIGVRQFEFRVSDRSVAEGWIECIAMARDSYLRMIDRTCPIILPSNCFGTKFWHRKPLGFQEHVSYIAGLVSSKHLDNSEDHQYELFSSLDIAKIQRLEQILIDNRQLSRYIINAFLSAVLNIDKKDRSQRSKHMGWALVMWLSNSNSKSASPLPAPEAISDKQSNYTSPLEVLSDWVDISLTREFKTSCGGSSDTSGKGTSAGGHNPFRMDTPETLLLAALLKGSVLSWGSVAKWIAPILLSIAAVPAKYTCSPPSPAATPAPALISSLVNNNNNTPDNQQGCGHDSEMQHDSQYDRYAADFASEDLVQMINTATQHNSSCEQLLRDNQFRTQYRLARACALLVDRLQHLQSALPPGVLCVLRCIKALTLGSRCFAEASDLTDDSAGGIEFVLQESDTEVDLSAAGAISGAGAGKMLYAESNYRMYYMSCCALLFLRLICPAIISPIEWGALRNWNGSASSTPSSSSQPSQPQSDASEVGAESPQSSPATRADSRDGMLSGFGCPSAVLILMAHTLTDSGNWTSHWAGDIADFRESHRLFTEIADSISIAKAQSLVDQFTSKVTVMDEGEAAELVSSGCDFDSLLVRKALVDYAKVVQKVANMTCMTPDKMKAYVRDDVLKRAGPVTVTSDGINNNNDHLIGTSLLTDQYIAIVNSMRLFFNQSANEQACV